MGAESVIIGSVVEKDGTLFTNVHKEGQAEMINPMHMLCEVLVPIPV
jgi:hypothetical protein